MKNLKNLFDKFGDLDLNSQYDNFEIHTTTHSRVWKLREYFQNPYEWDFPMNIKYTKSGSGKFPYKSWKYYRGTQWKEKKSKEDIIR